MRLRRKMLLIMVIAVIAATASVYLGSQAVVLGGFLRLEEDRVQENIERNLSILSNEYEDLNSKASDWAEWDDTYDFVQNKNDAYINANLIGISSCVNLRLNIMLFIDNSGQIVYSKAVCLQRMMELPVMQEILDLISADDFIWNHSSTESSITGILPIEALPFLIASRPILTSEGEGPIAGTLIFGRCLDNLEIEYLSKTLHLPISTSLFNSSEADSDFDIAKKALSEEEPKFVQVLNKDTIAGYSLIEDVYGEPFMIFRLTMERDTYRHGEATVAYFLITQIVIGVIFGVAVMLVIEKNVVSRVDRMANEVKNMHKNGNLEQISGKNRDELSILAGALDSMMAERLRAIEQVAAMVGHDLRNPLTGISNASYYLRMKMDSNMEPKTREMLDLIDKDVEYSNKIVNDLLEYSRAVNLELSETTPKSIVTDTLALVDVPAKVRIVDSTEDKPKMRVDADKIKRVMVNIIKNAFDAMPEGGDLTIESKSTGRNVEIVFADNGAGIPKETLEKLFTPLVTTKARGMGFGLAICKRIIEAHGGKISMESTVGKGTTLTLTIPIEPKLDGGDK